jgi:hypothetical protein
MKNPLLTCARPTHMIRLGVIAMLLISALPAFSATWTVTSTGDDPNDTTTLRGALAAATDGCRPGNQLVSFCFGLEARLWPINKTLTVR